MLDELEILFQEHVAECQRELLAEYAKTECRKALNEYAESLQKQGLIGPF